MDWIKPMLKTTPKATAHKEVIITLTLSEIDARWLLSVLQNPTEFTEDASKNEEETSRLHRVHMFNAIKFAIDNPE